MSMTMKPSTRVNGLDLDALSEVVGQIQRDPRKGMVAFRVRSAWRGQTRSRSTVESYTIGGQEVRRHFDIDVDEPYELLGQNSAPNPQEMLMTALNACIMVGYVAGAAVKGITLEKVEIETDRRAGPARLPRDRPRRAARLRSDSLHRAHQGQRDAGPVPRDPRDGDEDLAELLQRLASHPDRRVCSKWSKSRDRPALARAGAGSSLAREAVKPLRVQPEHFSARLFR